MKTRREFLKTTSSALLLPLIWKETNDRKAERLPLAFSTLGCPKWEWKKILDFAVEHGFTGIELRGLEGNLDLPSHPVFSPSQIEQTKHEISSRKLRIACVSSSANLYVKDTDKRAKELGDARRFIDLAAALGSPCVRVFGGKDEADKSPAPDTETKNRVAAGLRELGTYAGPRNVTVILESHDHFTSSTSLKDVLLQANSENVGLLWDAYHTFADGHEDPEFTVGQLGKWIRHTHLKDSAGNEQNYVLTGRGTVPIKRQISALRATGYNGFFCFEWEKLWHPDLLEPEIAIADFAHVVGDCLGDARACGL
jgi:sugar phosphate isomerase/epimerase